MLSGQRSSFGVRFDEAEDTFSDLLTTYSIENVNARCPALPSEAFVLLNLALAHSSQERFATANGLFARAERLLDIGEGVPEQQLETERELLSSFRAQDLLNRANALGKAEFSLAAEITLADRAGPVDLFDRRSDFSQLTLENSAEEKKRVVDEAAANYARAHIMLLEGDLNEASNAIDYALNLIDLTPRSAAVYRPRFLYERALINYEKRNYQAARNDAEQSALLFSELLPGSPLEARALWNYGRTLARMGRIDDALAAFERGVEIYEENPVVVEYKTLWPFFQIALRERKRSPERADELSKAMFRAAQVIRRSITAQTVSGAAALLAEGDSEKAEVVRQWRQAHEEYSALKALQVIQLQDPLNQIEITESLSRQVRTAKSRVEQLKAQRNAMVPEYQSAISSPISASILQNTLNEGEALVQIVLGEPRSLVFIVDHETISVNEIAATEGQISTLVSLLRRAIKFDGQGRLPDFRVDTAHLLFNLLFANVDERLSRYQKLFVATNGAMQSLPFELLVTEDPTVTSAANWRSGDYTSVAFLNARQAISYVPSPRNLVDIRQRAGLSSANQTVSAYGNFRSGVDPDRVLAVAGLPVTCMDLAKAVDGIGNLPGTGTEAATITAILGQNSKLSTGDDFTEEAIKSSSDSGELADFQVLHLATHGILWPSPDCFTEPALTVTASSDEESDGLLTAREIRGLNLDAQLVVLSACNTASTYLNELGASLQSPIGFEGIGNTDAERAFGVIRRENGGGGESLSGLARAFFSAGARTVLATHWSVADAETTKLMEDFYNRLWNSRATFAEALRGAQSDLRSRRATSHPFFWAPFVLIGDGSQSLVRDQPPTPRS